MNNGAHKPLERTDRLHKLDLSLNLVLEELQLVPVLDFHELVLRIAVGRKWSYVFVPPHGRPNDKRANISNGKTFFRLILFTIQFTHLLPFLSWFVNDRTSFGSPFSHDNFFHFWFRFGLNNNARWWSSLSHLPHYDLLYLRFPLNSLWWWLVDNNRWFWFVFYYSDPFYSFLWLQKIILFLHLQKNCEIIKFYSLFFNFAIWYFPCI